MLHMCSGKWVLSECQAWWVRCYIYAVVNGLSECLAWWVRCCIYAVVIGLSE